MGTELTAQTQASSRSLDFASLGHAYRDRLLHEVVPFWFPRACDTQYGGFLHCLDADGSLVDSDKSVWAQGRMAWMLLTLYREHGQNPDWLAWAEDALDFLERHCVDPSDGRMYFHVARDGTPIRKRRYAYSESFASIAYAAHAAVSGSAASRARALHWWNVFTDINFTPGKMAAKFTDARPSLALGPRMIGLVTAQELRKHLGPDPAFNARIDSLLDDILTLFVKPDLGAVLEMVAPDGSVIDHFDGRLLNPGHSIEGAWFILEEARYRGNDARLTGIACQMIDWSLERGWDTQYGGLFSHTDLDGKPVQEYSHNMKFWWPHNEALIATVLAHGLTGEPRYAEWHERIADWAFSHFQDREHGEWYGYLNRDGSLSNTLKGSLWKSFFHHPRCLSACASYCRDFAGVAPPSRGAAR